ncbi:MAG: hypothetical protein IMF18_13975 [Proteobacteria bacterium]|nr:hypothetical protein [Pseudomonadota bacterium]
MDYPEIKDVDLPDTAFVAYAVCYPCCSAKEFIVDGDTRECQKSGSLMFRTGVKKYHVINDSSKPVSSGDSQDRGV